MSEFLGPIHFMMYEKIKFQDKISEFLLDNDTKELDRKILPVSKESLDKIINQENIHGFLSSKIDVVENRLAYALTNSKNTKEKLFEFGKIQAKGKKFDNYNEIFNDLNMMLLDGMPCDNALSASIDGDDNLLLVTNINVHKKYFKDFINPKYSLDNTCDGDHDHNHHEAFEISHKDFDLKNENSPYHKFRYEFLKGYFSQSPYDISLIGGINYKIYKR